MLLKVNPDGSQVRLKDVADVGLGGQDYSINAQSTAARRPVSRSSWPPAPTRWIPPRRSARPSPTWNRSCRRA
ncbi:hypothetical protein ABFY65_00560 [Pseudomonas aeruginosa]